MERRDKFRRQEVFAFVFIFWVLLLCCVGGFVGWKLFSTLFSLSGMGLATLGIARADWVIDQNKTPDLVVRDIKQIRARSIVILVLCTFILLLVFFWRHD
jgi:hypothetical protein